MTREKDLKKRVRARMAKTGERYTAARAHIAKGTAGSRARRGKKARSAGGGQHGETYALGHVLASAGALDPRTGEGFSEAMLLGIGGGLGAAYFVFEYKGQPPHLYIGTRVGHQYPYTAEFATSVCAALGIEAQVHETGGKKAARANLARALEQGRSALTWVDMGGLPYWHIPEAMGGAMPHVVAVTGLDEDAGTATVIDYSATPFSLSIDQLTQARARLRKAKNRVIEIPPESAAGDLASAVERGIQTCVQSLRDGALVASAAGNFGLSALEKWAKLVNAPRNKKGWPQAFRPGVPLFVGLRQMFFWIEAAGTGGGGFRPMYADFLAQASEIASRPALRDVAGEYRALGKIWTELAHAALPDSVPILAETRALLEAKRDAMREQGPQSADAIVAANARLGEIEASMASQFPLDDRACAELYGDFERRLTDLVEGEKAAAEHLAAAIG